MTIFFTSDHHFGHQAIIHYRARPFVDFKDMDAEMIRRWNAVVSPTDTVYHLGDLTMKQESAFTVLSELNGRIRCIPGNHDEWCHPDIVRMNYGERVKILPAIYTFKLNIQHITLCHFPMRRWPESHYGTWHLFGHVHGELDGQPIGLSLDVGVDSWNFAPVSLEQVAERMSQLTPEGLV